MPVHRRLPRHAVAALAIIQSFACSPAPASPAAIAARAQAGAAPATAAPSRAALEPANQVVRARVEAGRLPGAVLLVAQRGVVLSKLAVGTKERSSSEPMTADTLFDLESLTKAVTAAAALALSDAGKLDLGAPVAKYLPEFTGGGREMIAVRDLLDHSSGLPADIELVPGMDAAAVWSAMMHAPLAFPPRTKVSYSDLGFRIAGRVMEAAAGAPLDRIVREAITGPLGMKDTLYNPPPSLRARIAGTGFSPSRKRALRGEMTDDIDIAFGGVAGCDGLFSTAADLAVFAQAFLDGGVTATRTRLLSSRSVELATTNDTPWADLSLAEKGWMDAIGAGPKGFGWDVISKGSYMGNLSPRSFGKGGIAGTILVVDPAAKLVVVYLTNRGVPSSLEDFVKWNEDIAPAEVFTKIGAAVGAGG